ncbi:HMCN [Mytilus edulis]|uniref:HMCN n=1 Tax=Mytilus edulis TaxID=6550 RepID=A0A8S3SKC3_MYTED|nr:HMCN [Mytilus edulis]
MGMELAKFPSELEYDGGVNYIQDMGGTNDVWFGLSSDGTPPYIYKWTDGEPTSWTYWTPDEPNAEASDRCIRLKRNENYGYATRHCSIKYDYLCSFTGSNPIVLTLNDSNVNVSYKTDVILACSYESTLPVSRIFWSFDNSVTTQTTNMGIPGNSETVIYRIDHAGPDNIGVYQCNVENIFGTERGTEVSFSIILGYPTVQTNQTTVTVLESSSFSLYCFYDGYPEVTSVVWIKNSRRIIMDTVMSDGMATIMISNAKLGDSGNYSCNVSNTQGATESSNITVEIIKVTRKCRCPCSKMGRLSAVDFSNFTKEELRQMLQPEIKKLKKNCE